jgi:hypothetical protein
MRKCKGGDADCQGLRYVQTALSPRPPTHNFVHGVRAAPSHPPLPSLLCAIAAYILVLCLTHEATVTGQHCSRFSQCKRRPQPVQQQQQLKGCTHV